MSILTNPRRPRMSDDALAHWPTPVNCTRALLDEHPPPTKTIVEPSAGSGGIVAPLALAGYSVDCFEVRPECEPDLLQAGARSISIGDWLSVSPDDRRLPKRRFGIIGNPPYKPSEIMLEHVRRCLALCPYYVALHLPLSFLSGGSDRRVFWSGVEDLAMGTSLSGLYFFSSRPRYVDGGGQFEPAWFVWDAEWQRQGKQAIKMLDLSRP